MQAPDPASRRASVLSEMLAPRLLAADRRSLMSNITPYRAPILATRTGREISRLESRAELARRADRLHMRRVTEVTVDGLDAAAYISMVEWDRAQVAPHAAARLRGIADIGAMGIMSLIHEAAHDR
jgi:hypothetical protein